MSRTVPVTQAVSLSLYFAILALLILTTFWPNPVEGASVWVLLAVKLVPLLILMPGLLKSSIKTFQWLCFIILLYFTDAVTRAYLSNFDWPPTLMTVLTAGLFVSAILRIRAATPVKQPDTKPPECEQ